MTMTRQSPLLALLLIAAPSVVPAAEVEKLPFVGCVTHEMTGDQTLTRDKGQAPSLPSEQAKQLAYYAAEDLSVLAPRGWACAALSGSNGKFLMVAPPDAAPEDWYKAEFSGPAVQLSLNYSGTSGRFTVARVLARLFPARRKFVESVIEEGIEKAEFFPFGSYPEDSIERKGDNIVEYQTPAGAEGMGTQSRLHKGEQPIDGVAVIREGAEEFNLLKLDIRLPPEQRGLAQVIRETAERR